MDASRDRGGSGVGEPAYRWFYITPNDDQDLPTYPRAIYVGGAGDVAMVGRDGVECTFKDLAVDYHPLRPLRIKATGTTATDMIGLY